VRAAKAALHVANPPRGAPPLCREAQLAELEAALTAAAAEGRGGALYLSGLPGTGAPPGRNARGRSTQFPRWPSGVFSLCLPPLTHHCVYGTLRQVRWHERDIAVSGTEHASCVPVEHTCRKSLSPDQQGRAAGPRSARARGRPGALAALTGAACAAGKSLTVHEALRRTARAERAAGRRRRAWCPSTA